MKIFKNLRYNVLWILKLKFLPAFVGSMLINAKRILLLMSLEKTPIFSFFDATLDDKTVKQRYRTHDGSYNNVNCPFIGMKGQPFGRFCRNIDRRYQVFDPDPVLVASELLTRYKEITIPGANAFVTTWIQFMIHDWMNHALNAEIQVSASNDQNNVVKASLFLNNFYTFNENSHYWDGSQIYAEFLRASDESGHLLIESDTNYLPLDSSTGMEMLGFPGNIWYGLSLMHWLFTKEHNTVCDILAKMYPRWTGDQLFNTSRLIITALIAKIHVIEWTETILPNKFTKYSEEVVQYGILGKMFKKAYGSIKIDDSVNPMFSGFPGGNTISDKVNFAHIEEFSSVYRMHSLLPETVQIGEDILNLTETLFEESHKVNTKYSVSDLLRSLGKAPACELTLNNYPSALRNITVNKQQIDLAVVDIFRDRERGIPRYNEFRRNFKLSPVKKFSDFKSCSPQVRQKLRGVYDNDIEKIDLQIGLLIEDKLPECIFGETLYTVFVVHTNRRIYNDRFFTTDFHAGVYTQFGMEWIENTSLKDILLRHCTELDPETIPDNPFALWK
jgi:hypothetical protein